MSTKELLEKIAKEMDLNIAIESIEDYKNNLKGKVFDATIAAIIVNCGCFISCMTEEFLNNIRDNEDVSDEVKKAMSSYMYNELVPTFVIECVDGLNEREVHILLMRVEALLKHICEKNNAELTLDDVIAMDKEIIQKGYSLDEMTTQIYRLINNTIQQAQLLGFEYNTNAIEYYINKIQLKERIEQLSL